MEGSKFVSFDNSVYGGAVAKENIIGLTLEGTMYDYEIPTIVVTIKHGTLIAEMKFQYYNVTTCKKEYERIKEKLMNEYK